MSHVSHSKNSIVAIVIAVAIFIPGSKACLLWYTQYLIHPQTPTHTHTHTHTHTGLLQMSWVLFLLLALSSFALSFLFSSNNSARQILLNLPCNWPYFTQYSSEHKSGKFGQRSRGQWVIPNLRAIMETGLEEAQAGIKIAGRNINNLRYADDTTLMAESEDGVLCIPKYADDTTLMAESERGEWKSWLKAQHSES